MKEMTTVEILNSLAGVSQIHHTTNSIKINTIKTICIKDFCEHCKTNFDSLMEEISQTDVCFDVGYETLITIDKFKSILISFDLEYLCKYLKNIPDDVLISLGSSLR